MIKQHFSVPFDIKSLVTDKLPTVSDLASKESLHEIYGFQLENQHALPFYRLGKKSVEKAQMQAEGAYAMMIEALTRLFETPALIHEYFDSQVIREHGRYFIPYAKHTFFKRGMVGQSLCGRFDVAFDPVSESITGIYEFNGENAGLLFESTSLQNDLVHLAHGSPDPQLNDWSQLTQDTLGSYCLRSERCIAVIAELEYTEDTTFAEVMAQHFGAHMKTHLLDAYNSISFEYLNPRKPWMLPDCDDELDAIYLCLPWDEVLNAFPEGFMEWQSWADNVAFLEPAWKWFMSHKGMMAYLTHLNETDEDFRNRWSAVPVIRTYLQPDVFLSEGKSHVSKPAMGYQSSNIEIYDEAGGLVLSTEGDLLTQERVYQDYVPSGSMDDESRFILSIWMASGSRSTATGHPAFASALCFREFDSEVTDVDSERFIPHIYL